ncbi:MAG: hypothetical protein HRU01_16395, partial [Myxococcales bacterium]|nr:hypothetical protein [Myxococcales bacterium]
EPLLLGSTVEISFELPRSGPLCLTAEVAYQLVPDSGLIFHATAPSDREALSSFVVDMLMIDDPQQAVG